MDQERLQQTLEVLGALVKTEDLMAVFYTACSEAWPEYSSFWMSLAMEEEKHSRIVSRLKEILAANPTMFEPGDPVEYSAVESYNLGISEMAEEIHRGAIPLESALRFAEGMESSLLESRFLSLLTSKSSTYRELQDRVSRDTASHQKMIRDLFEAIRSGGSGSA